MHMHLYPKTHPTPLNYILFLGEILVTLMDVQSAAVASHTTK